MVYGPGVGPVTTDTGKTTTGKPTEENFSSLIKNILRQSLSGGMMAAGKSLGGPSMYEMAQTQHLKTLETQQQQKLQMEQEKQKRKDEVSERTQGLYLGLLNELGNKGDPELLQQYGLGLHALGQKSFGTAVLKIAKTGKTDKEKKELDEKTRQFINENYIPALREKDPNAKEIPPGIDIEKVADYVTAVNASDPQMAAWTKENLKTTHDLLIANLGLKPGEKALQDLNIDLKEAAFKRQGGITELLKYRTEKLRKEQEEPQLKPNFNPNTVRNKIFELAKSETGDTFYTEDKALQKIRPENIAPLFEAYLNELQDLKSRGEWGIEADFNLTNLVRLMKQYADTNKVNLMELMELKDPLADIMKGR